VHLAFRKRQFERVTTIPRVLPRFDQFASATLVNEFAVANECGLLLRLRSFVCHELSTCLQVPFTRVIGSNELVGMDKRAYLRG